MKLLLNRWIACGLLIAATITFWQYRFQFSSHELNAFDLTEQIRKHPQKAQKHGYRLSENDKGIIQIGVDKHPKALAAFSLEFPELKDVRFLYLQCDYRWENVVQGEYPWSHARATIDDKNTEGKWRHATDSRLFHGTGTQEWKHLELIRELTDLTRETRFSFQMLGESGVLEIKNLTIHKVSLRPWASTAAVLLILCWGIWIFFLLKAAQATGWLRLLLGSKLLLIGGWIAVFPQTHNVLYPLGIPFQLGQASHSVAQPVPQPTPPPPSQQSPAPKTPPKTAPQTPKAKTPPTTQTSKPPAPSAPRNRGVFHKTTRNLAHHFSWLHIPVFAAFSLLFFVIMGRASGWVFTVALAILSETIPPSIRYGFDAQDLLDLGMNLLGVTLALVIWKVLRPFLTKIRLIPKKRSV